MSRPRRHHGPVSRFTFRGNLEETRHGWLRLTPAYSVQLVRELLAEHEPNDGPVLDPFCGTGTTVLACRERGIDCSTVDLNPFLVWLARAKTDGYGPASVARARDAVGVMAEAALQRTGRRPDVPPIHRIEKWWAPTALDGLARAFEAYQRLANDLPRREQNLALLAFCRTLISAANVSFGHQSMSFRAESRRTTRRDVARSLLGAFETIAAAAGKPLSRSRRKAVLGDSRHIDRLVPHDTFTSVVTSPPYSNRMSYIRELRPYMYWLGYLVERKDAGVLDWKAIGGTWGAATSSLSSWRPNPELPVPFPGFDGLVRRIGRHHSLLGRYVHKYFQDMLVHARGIARVVAPGGTVRYVVGNSKFYDVVLPAQDIFGALFEAAGLEDAKVTMLRKRTSKRELFEYLVEARRSR